MSAPDPPFVFWRDGGGNESRERPDYRVLAHGVTGFDSLHGYDAEAERWTFSPAQLSSATASLAFPPKV